MFRSQRLQVRARGLGGGVAGQRVEKRSLGPSGIARRVERVPQPERPEPVVPPARPACAVSRGRRVQLADPFQSGRTAQRIQFGKAGG